jgi:cell division protein FtsB
LTAFIITTVALGVVLIASGVLHILRERHYGKSLATVKSQRDRLNEENESLHEAIGKQSQQNMDLYKKNTKLREDLTEAQATVQLLRMPSDHATAPLEEATPLSYADAKPAIDKAAQSSKRSRRGKITGTA